MAHDDELPIPDYDQLPLTELRHRIRGLEEGPLRALFDHETEHGNRIPVLEILHARLKELHDGAEPSDGDPSNAPGVTPRRRFAGAGVDGCGAEHAAAARCREPDAVRGRP